MKNSTRFKNKTKKYSVVWWYKTQKGRANTCAHASQNQSLAGADPPPKMELNRPPFPDPVREMRLTSQMPTSDGVKTLLCVWV